MFAIILILIAQVKLEFAPPETTFYKFPQLGPLDSLIIGPVRTDWSIKMGKKTYDIESAILVDDSTKTEVPLKNSLDEWAPRIIIRRGSEKKEEPKEEKKKE